MRYFRVWRSGLNLCWKREKWSGREKVILCCLVNERIEMNKKKCGLHLKIKSPFSWEENEGTRDKRNVGLIQNYNFNHVT